ncbi:MAG TPA: 30S ribosomal protein S1 [Acidobacteriaceae bacterium]|jgi:small subunit ribosomal protein S1|nr:30S ribosomal protein S1 [Acidobacteriaceae bacterium]
MPNETTPASESADESASGFPVEIAAESNSESPSESPAESFADLLAQFEHTHSHQAEGAKQLQGTVVSLDAEFVYLDIGYKSEGILARSAFDNNADAVTAGDTFPVSVKGRNAERYYELSRHKVVQPTDWSSLEEAFAQKTPVVGVVTAMVKGGLTVDVGVRAFMPASRSGTRDAAEMEKLVGQEITCRITKLDVTDEDVVVDRRVLSEELARAQAQDLYSEMKEGDIVSGAVRSFTAYGAFIDLGGIDGLLHISDISWGRVSTPEDVLAIGQELQLKVLKVDAEGRRVSLGLKQLEPERWDSAAEKYQVGQRITGTVTRLMDFGAFVELEPGIEGLIHVSEMSWVKKIHKPSDILKPGDTVEAVVLSVKQEERRIALGLKQALGDPWADAPSKFPVGSAIEGPVTRLMNFGAFVQLAEGVEGLVHVSEITAERRIHHPQDMLRVGQTVKAQVLAIDPEKRQFKLSMKQLVPTSIGEYLEEHKAGDVVSGRVVEQSADSAVVELGEGIRATCPITASASVSAKTRQESAAGVDLSALTSMLNARWKSGVPAVGSQPEPLAVGQIRSFRIVQLDCETKKIELELK